MNFNSRPRKEVDEDQYNPYLSISISTHDLARRSTFTENAILILLDYFNSRPRKEVDDVRSVVMEYFTAFQLTTSQGGRQQFLRKKFSFQNHFLCSLHIIYSYYINIVFFSTLFLAKSSFFLVRIH